jgi:hypothetical protein
MSYRHLSEICAWLSLNEIEIPDLMQQCLDGAYYFDPVVSVSIGYESVEMIDIEVQDDHSFVADGFITHNCQGITTDVAILDEKTLMRSEIGKYSEDFDIRKLIYTAASRARKQLIVMV